LRFHCLSSDLAQSEVAQFSALVLCRRHLKDGQALYRAGDAFAALYLVRTGLVKSIVLNEGGREQVSGFYMPGEMVGVDGIAAGKHASDAVALGDTDVCVLPYERLEKLSHRAPAIDRHLHRILSKEVVRKQSMMLLLGSLRAEERIASFLLNLSQRFTARGFSACDFVLRMTREEIGSLLGMQLETVSRVFSRMHKEGLIQIDGKHVRLLSPQGLRRMIGN